MAEEYRSSLTDSERLALPTSGVVNHGEYIETPTGTINDWDIIVAPSSSTISTRNNYRGFTLGVEPAGNRAWRVTSTMHYDDVNGAPHDNNPEAARFLITKKPA